MPASEHRTAGKRLYLLRHAKSARDQPALNDHERPLNRRGRESCVILARHIAATAILPDQVLCSTALRTRETVKRIEAALGRRFSIRFVDQLYLGEPTLLLDAVRGLDDQVDSAMLVGHNPGLHELAILLGGRSPAATFGKFPTGALATFDIAAAHWREAGPQTATLTGYVTPRLLAP